MTTAVVFDFGAVVFTWRPHEIVRARFAERAATPAAGRQLAADIFGHPDWHAFDRGGLEQTLVAQRIAERLALPLQAVQDLVAEIPDHLTPMPDTVGLLARLHERRRDCDDIRLYYLSNMPAPFARALEARHDFLRWFDGGIFSGDARCIKPEPEIFAMLESRHALEPGRTVFIDDLPSNVEAARMRGWRGIQFESAPQVERQLAMHLP